MGARAFMTSAWNLLRGLVPVSPRRTRWVSRGLPGRNTGSRAAICATPFGICLLRSRALLFSTVAREAGHGLPPGYHAWLHSSRSISSEAKLRSLTSKEESLLRLRAPTCLDLPTHGALSQFGFFVWVLLRCSCTHPPSIVF